MTLKEQLDSFDRAIKPYSIDPIARSHIYALERAYARLYDLANWHGHNVSLPIIEEDSHGNQVSEIDRANEARSAAHRD
jgi:hypothetical protein